MLHFKLKIHQTSFVGRTRWGLSALSVPVAVLRGKGESGKGGKERTEKGKEKEERGRIGLTPLI